MADVKLFHEPRSIERAGHEHGFLDTPPREVQDATAGVPIPASAYSISRAQLLQYDDLSTRTYVCTVNRGDSTRWWPTGYFTPAAKNLPEALKMARTAFLTPQGLPSLPPWCVRVFELTAEGLRRMAFFSSLCNYRDDECALEHSGSASTFRIEAGAELPQCTLDISSRSRMSVKEGGLKEWGVTLLCDYPLIINGELVPPATWRWAPLRFSAQVIIEVRILAFGSHPDPRNHVVRGFCLGWHAWRNGLMVACGSKQRSLFWWAKREWPGFTDRAYIRSLNAPILNAIHVRLWQNWFDRCVGTHVPTLSAVELTW